MAINRQKFLPSSKGGSLVKVNKTLSKGSSSAIVSENVQKNLGIVSVKIIEVDKILKGTLASQKKELDNKKRQESSKRREKIEEKLETKPNAEKGKIELPKKPRLGIFDWIKNFIGNIILGYFAVRLVEHLPKIIPIVKFLGQATDFVINFGGKLLDGLVTFIDWGYKAYDATRGFVKNIFGKDGVKQFDQLSGLLNQFLNLAIIAGLAVAGSGGFGGGKGRPSAGARPRPGVGGRPRVTTSGGKRLGGIDIRNPLRQKPKVTVGRGGNRALLSSVRPFLKRIPLPVVGALIDFGLSVALGENPGRAAFRAIGAGILATIGGGLAGALGLAGGPLAVATAALGSIAGGTLGDMAGGAIYDLFFGGKKSSGKSGKYAGGGITRGGKSQGGVKRTIPSSKKSKYRRKLAPQKPGEVEATSPGADVGGENKLFGLFPNPLKMLQKATDVMNPFKAIQNAGKNLGESDYFGPILAITSKILLGQKPTQQDYKNVGLGINLLVAKGIDDGKLRGGLAAFAEGGFVDPKTLDAISQGGDISDWVAKSFKDATESNAQKTLKEIQENLRLKKDTDKQEKQPGVTGDEFSTEMEGVGVANVSLNPYRKAFLDTLAYAEGTANYPNNGYNTMFTGKQFTGYRDHPRKIQVSGRYRSDAAGRYQFLSTTWDGLGFSDFSPANQDMGAIKLLNATTLSAVDKGDWPKAFHGARRIWASLPGAGYGQPEKNMKTLVGYANSRLEKYKKGQLGSSMVMDRGVGQLPGGVTSQRMVTGPSAYIGGSADYHIDTKFHRSLGMANMVSAVDKLANAYSARGRKMEFSNPGVAGAVWNPKASPKEKQSLLQRAFDAHSHSRFMRAEGFLPFDYYIPKKNDNRFGKSAEGAEILLPTFGGKVDVGTKYSGYGKSAEIYSGNKMVAMTGHGDVRYARGGITLDGPHVATLGEEGKEFVIDADSTATIEKTFPGFLDSINSAKYEQAINVLRNFASYESGAEQTVIIAESPAQNIDMGGGYGDSGSAIFMNSAEERDPFDSLYMGG